MTDAAQLAQKIIAAANDFDANDFGAQYYDADENGNCAGTPDMLSIRNVDGEWIAGFHPSEYPANATNMFSGATAEAVFAAALNGNAELAAADILSAWNAEWNE